ncbi:MAG: bestrophin family protein [Bacteroidota bacterium]
MINYDNKAWHKQLFAWKGTVIWGTMPRMLFFMVWTATIVYLYDHSIISKDIKIDMVVYNVVGLALGLLLVFRTNTSYDRYWEGRRLIGSTVNSSRNLALLLNELIPKAETEKRTRLVRLISAFNYATKERLREGVTREHLPMLNEDQKDEVFKSNHVPNAIMKVIHKEVTLIKRSGFAMEPDLIAINNELTTLINNLGGMERIRNTPVPFAYAAHLQLFIMLYFLALPFGLYEKFHWIAVPVIGIVSLILLGINEIGVEIEDPFGNDPNDLPMDTICENIEKNIREILD